MLEWSWLVLCFLGMCAESEPTFEPRDVNPDMGDSDRMLGLKHTDTKA